MELCQPRWQENPAAVEELARSLEGSTDDIMARQKARRREVERAHLENLRARLAEQQMIHGMREALGAAIYQMQGPLNVIQAAIGMLGRGGADPAKGTGLAGMSARVGGVDGSMTVDSPVGGPTVLTVEIPRG